MNKRMLIDTTHAEETRVVVLDGNRLEDYDVETSAKKQLKGNIYLAKVIRVEPSLQAAFVEYGGNRHGFLAFSEIHPDYYQIPVADRERLIALQEEEARAEEVLEDAREAEAEASAQETAGEEFGDSEQGHFEDRPHRNEAALSQDNERHYGDELPQEENLPTEEPHPSELAPEADGPVEVHGDVSEHERVDDHAAPSFEAPAPDQIGGEVDQGEERRASPQTARFLRQYKIQEVIRRRQILLIQVVKEERGNKGAALTSYISLAGRFCVLMPNSLRGGGVSRKITSAGDRRRLKEITAELEIPRGMAMIIRTAGAQRPRPEIRRDCEYLLQLWDDIRDQTMRAMAPALIYEEANLIKRAIRDVYTRDIEEIVVDGESGWKAAREFMRNLMPANAQKVQLWRDRAQPLFSHYQVEHYLDSMLQPVVQLRSGGYLVIDQTEALVAIDVNSGRSTRERGIEETALRTNLEAADEVARCLRLRDLAGLIVIDFIDMESRRHNVMVERRLKDALKNDRARIQLGTISPFGLMEMSRQRLRPSIAESAFVTCPHCAGSGFVRGTDSAALHVLRAIEEEGARQRAAEILVYVAGSVALYIFNHKRVWLSEIEQRHRMVVAFAADESLIAPALRIEKVRPQVPLAAPAPSPDQAGQHFDRSDRASSFEAETAEADPDEDDEEMGAEALEAGNGATSAAPQEFGSSASATAESSDEEHRRRRRRRRRRSGRRDTVTAGPDGVAPVDGEQPENDDAAFPQDDVVAHDEDEPLSRAADDAIASDPASTPPAEAANAGRKRGRRGGRGRNTPRDALAASTQMAGATPADPFAGAIDIFDVIEQDAGRPAVTADPPEPVAEMFEAEIVQAPAPAELPQQEPPAAVKPRRKRAAAKAAAGDGDAPEAEPETPPETLPARKPRSRKPAKVAQQVELLEPPMTDPEPATGAANENETVQPPAGSETEERSRAIVQPILIDTLAEPAARRTGWWRR